MNQEIIKHRGGLKNTLKAIKKGFLTVGFIGGSITEASCGHNWPEFIADWLVERFPDVRVVIENAAIGGTGSDLGVVRAKRDLIDRGCDIVFIEYAVNDNDTASERRNRSREGLIRTILTGGKRDAVIVYTFCEEMYKDMTENKVPPSIQEFEVLAEHYNIGSVWMGLHALQEVNKGRMSWEEWLPDWIHPEYKGSFVYAEPVIEYLEKELAKSPIQSNISNAGNLPDALHVKCWDNVELLPLSKVKIQGSWLIKRWTRSVWMDHVLVTSTEGDKLFFDFEGRGLALGFDSGKAAAGFRYRIDEGEWRHIKPDIPEWCWDDGWHGLEVLTDDLNPGKHEFQLEVVQGSRPECRGIHFVLGLIGIIK